ncbi:hypothetical protein CALVIDRAFT_569307 [Calocera viscosa TUFC12733]|uniref:P-loop containing nucleoside triphosphate hydrolase protein n=1 Tax=Calocera viscosa (strain TUFC12733) TaxID=1330018 RepID=A0A167G437_CALVF|nr:hypothetical protein CALVIDRAFT_569307 [Calocera viscosa TUFC12733]
MDALEVAIGRMFQSGVRAAGEACTTNSTWRDPRLLPAYASLASLLLLLIRATSRVPTKPLPVSTILADAPDQQSISQRITAVVQARGGWVVCAFNIARVVGTVALVGLTIASVVLSSQQGEDVSGSVQTPIGGGKRSDWKWDCTGHVELGLLVGYTYAALLSLLALVLAGSSCAICSFHAASLLFIQFLVFFWRNLLPLTTYGGAPADGMLPWLLWTRGSFVTLVGLALPALVPRVYVPYDMANPATTPAPEQTASIFSFVFFSFMEPLVTAAWRLPSLPYDKLPPLADTSWSINLRKRAMDRLDPLRRRELGKKDQHILFGLFDIFRWEFISMAFFLILQVLVGFMGPIGINRLLTYIERDGEGATVRPWVWIGFLFLAPILNSLALNLYSFTSQRMCVQAESILTQLIFEHALRVRLTDDTTASASSTSTPGASTPTASGDQTADSAESSAREPSEAATESTTLLHREGSNTEADSTVPVSTNAGASAGTGGTEQGKTSEEKDETPAASVIHLSAKINSLFGTDIASCIGAKDFLVMFIDCPFEVIVCAYFLWTILSWAAVVGMLFIIVTLPVPGLIANKMQDAQAKLMQKKDARVQTVTESVGIIRMIKMFGWEPLVKTELSTRRAEELRYLRLKKILGIVNNEVTYAFQTPTLVLKRELDAARVFSSAPVFDTLRRDMLTAVMMLSSVIEAKVSLDRITAFLCFSSLLDKYAERAPERVVPELLPPDGDVVGFRNATFTWHGATTGPLRPGQRNFRLHFDTLVFKNAELNVIVGPTGCGKTSILMALLGEMHFESQSVDSWFNLPRGGGIAYAAQESRTFYSELRSKKPGTRKASLICALEPDLAMFTAGDETEVGERGLTLSGGQKARITLARALYSPAHILLLDDVVSSLDVHTARWIVEKCLQGDLLQGRTVILVTHAVALIAPVAANVVSLSAHGRVISQGPLNKSLTLDPTLRQELEESKERMEVDRPLPTDDGKLSADKKVDGTLVLEEERVEGRVRWATVQLFLDSYGGLLFWIVLVLGYMVAIGSDILATWWLGHWAQAYVDTAGTVNVPYYLAFYIGIVALQELGWFTMQFFYALGSIRALN